MVNLENEIWKPVKGYEQEYLVSSLGRIMTIPREAKRRNKGTIKVKSIIRSQSLNTSNYLKVTLIKNRKLRTFLVHRLVAESFLDNPQEFKEVNHKDCDRLNNKLSNLEWCDRKYNHHHAIKSGRFHYATNPNRKWTNGITSLSSN